MIIANFQGCIPISDEWFADDCIGEEKKAAVMFGDFLRKVRVLDTRYDYPPIFGTDRPRYAAISDIIHVTPEQAEALVADGKVEYYEQ